MPDAAAYPLPDQNTSGRSRGQTALKTRGIAIPLVLFRRRGTAGGGMQEKSRSGVIPGGIAPILGAPEPLNAAIVPFVPAHVRVPGK